MSKSDDKKKGGGKSGKDENQEKKKVRTDLAYYNSIWGVKLPDFPLATQEFRFTVLRPDVKRDPKMNIDGLVETVEWRDEGTFDNINSIPVLRGTVQLRKPHPSDPSLRDLEIHDGHVIKCQVNWGGRWKEVWQMRIQKTTVAMADGAWTLELADDLQLLSRSMYDYKFAAGESKRKRGYRYWEIVRLVCKDAGIPLDKKMPKGKRWIKDFNQQDISPLEAIRQAVEQEQEWTGRPHLIYWRDGELHVKRMRRNPLLYTFADQIRGGDISTSRKAEVYTQVTAKGSGKVSKKKDDGSKKEVTKDYEITVTDKAAVREFGLIHQTVNVGSDLESRTEVKHLAMQKIKESVKPLKVIEGFSHYGIAFVRRGDAVRINFPSEKIRGEAGYLWVTSISHSLSGGDYTMSMDLTTTLHDPLDPNALREAHEKAIRARKSEEKGNDDSAGVSGTLHGVKSSWAQFSKLVAAGTGIGLRVMGAWCLAEGGPDDNPLNIGPGNHYNGIEGGAKATIDLLHTGPYSGILSAAGNDSATISAIVASPWCPGCSGYESLLRRTYDSVSVSH